MADFKETVMGYTDVDNYASFCSGERRWINRILKLKADYPNEVDIVAYPEENQGIILAHMPKKWFKVAPPRQVNYTDEQKAAMAERLKAAREAKEK